MKENLPFKKYASICKLQQLNGLELGENYLTDMACSRFVKAIAGDWRNEIAQSILSDGSTDKGIVEDEIVYARYIRDGKPKSSLIKVQQPNTVDAGGITDVIKEAINSLKPHDDSDVFLDNFFKKVIKANFDGASVMSGHKGGVQKRLKDMQPGLAYTHCVAHRLELAMLNALKLKDDYLHRFDENVNGLFKFYYYSPPPPPPPVRRKELKDMAAEIEIEFKQFGLLKNIRWLASWSRALSILEQNYYQWGSRQSRQTYEKP